MPSVSAPRFNARSLGFTVDFSGADRRKLSRFLGGEIRKIARVQKTALKRAAAIVRKQLVGAVKGKGKGYEIAGPHAARSSMHDLLHGATGGIGADYGIGDPRSVEIALTASGGVIVGWRKPALRERIERFQFGSVARRHFGQQLLDNASRSRFYRRAFARNPGLSKKWKPPVAYQQPDRPVVEPIQRNANENLSAWIEGNIRSLVREGRAGDLAAAASGSFLNEKEDF